MTAKKSKFNPQAIPTNQAGKKGKQAKDTKKRKLFASLGRKKKDVNTRAIRFAPRTAQNFFSISFACLFVVMCVAVLLVFARVDTLARIANSKAVNKEELVTGINEGLENTEQLQYEGSIVVRKLFTFDDNNEDAEKWKKDMTTYLANGLSVDQLGFSDTKEARTAKDISFIKLKTINEKKRQYRLYYSVSFTEGEEEKNAQIIISVSYAENDLKIIDLPQFVNLNKSNSNNNATYSDKAFLPKGEAVSDSKQRKIEKFTKRFFELYVVNDEKLGLISNLHGLEGGTLKGIEVTNVIQQEDGNLFVKGNYSFYYKEDSQFTSGFTLEVKPTKDSYFVEKMNGE